MVLVTIIGPTAKSPGHKTFKLAQNANGDNGKLFMYFSVIGGDHISSLKSCGQAFEQ